MYRKGSIYAKLLRDPETEKIRRYNDGKAMRSIDIDGMLEYEYKFSTHMNLDVWDKERKPIEEQGFDEHIIDELFDMAVKDFAWELANRMQYKNYKNLSKHGIDPNMVIWDE